MARRSFIAKTVSMLIGLPVALVIVLFAISNRHLVEVGFWPLPVVVEVPAYILGLCTMAFGFILGVIATWISGGSTRQRARVAEGKARRLADDLDHKTHEADNLRKALPAPEKR
tara:strand:+ start:234 stop:575 length:342 start_codon:yes stop_codon:yes gene_type:complete